MKRIGITILFLLSFPASVFALTADAVHIDKSESTLYLLYRGDVIKQYPIALGGNPVGHKVQEGDQRTPEGTYTLDYKKSDSAFHKAIHISYPNEQDKKVANALGVSPGGNIMIHGQRNGFGWLAFIVQKFNWTDGCVAVSNQHMDEIWNAVQVGARVEITQ